MVTRRKIKFKVIWHPWGGTTAPTTFQIFWNRKDAELFKSLLDPDKHPKIETIEPVSKGKWGKK